MNRRRRRLARFFNVIIPMIMACVITCLFQVTKVSADNSIPSDYRQIIYNQDNGLGSTEVNCLYQTKSGYIWVGTDGGLYRYGGKEFKIYNLWDTEKADVYFINNLFQDSKGRLWVATNNYGLFYIKGSETVHFSSEYYNGVKCVNDVCEGSDGTIYVATAYGIYTVDEESNTLIRNEHFARLNVKKVTLAGESIWGIYNGNTIFRIDNDGNFIRISSLDYTDYELTTITSDASGYIYVGTIGSDILKLTSALNVSVLHSGKDGINCIYPTGDRIYVCADNGFGFINKDETYSQIYGLIQDTYLSSMLVDYEGNFWVASSRMGLLYMGRGKFCDFNNRYNVPEKSTNCIAQFGGKKYIGTDNGLIVLDRTNKVVSSDSRIADIVNYIGGSGIKHILCDSKGNLWFSTYRRLGVVRYSSDGNIKNFDRYAGLGTNLVNCTYELSDGRIAVATEEGVAIIETDGTIQEKYGYEDGLEYTNILSLFEDENGTIMAGSDGGGLYMISKNGVETVTDNNGLSSNVVNAIKKGTDGIWIGTDNGLSYYDETFRGISNIDFSNNIYDIIIQDGNVWILGSKGLLATTEEELLSTSDLSERYFAAGDGLSRKININSHNMIDPGGNLYLCCNTGIMTFDTENVYSNSTAPKLTVSEVDVDGTIYYMDQIGGELTVPADTQRIAITFSVLSYINRDNISVTYKLNGFDNSEVTLNGNDTFQAVYTNLDGGEYTFTVSAVNGDGVATDQDITFTLIKERGFFEKTSVRIGFLVMVALLMGLVIFNLFRIRNQVEGKNKELENLAQEHETVLKSSTAKTDYLANMSNEIKIPVNAMISTAAKLLRETDSSDEDKEGLRTIVATGNDVLERVDETIQLAQLESGSVVALSEPYSLTTLICDLSDRMVNVLSEQPIKFLVDLGENIPDVLIGDFDKLKSVLEIILDNACKFTKEGSITLTVDSYKNPDKAEDNGEERLMFSISDTGIGMSEDRMNHIFEIYYINEGRDSGGYAGSGISLVIAKKLTEIIGAEIEVESTPGAGTTFTIALNQKTPDNPDNPTLASDRNVDRVSREEAEKMWTPDVKALLVDDSDLSRDVSLGLLSRMEMKCDIAASGISAVDMVMNNNYDIVFMDIAMPVMSGIDAMHEIRDLSGEDFDSLPVIGMSEDALMKNREELTSQGFTDVIVKPFDITTLASVMLRFVDSSKIKFRTNDVKQYMTESRYSEGLKRLENNFDVVRTLDRIGGNIDVYNRILATFYEQNKDAVNDLRRKFNTDYRGFRSRVHNIRTGCQNMGAADCAEITLRVENAINLGNKSYARDNLDMMLSSLQVVLECLSDYFEFVEGQKGMTDKEYAEKHVKDSSKKHKSHASGVVKENVPAKKEEPEETPAEETAPLMIDTAVLRNLKDAVLVEDNEAIDSIYMMLSAKTYVTDDMEFLEVLGKNVHIKDYDAINDLIETYFNLKSII